MKLLTFITALVLFAGCESNPVIDLPQSASIVFQGGIFGGDVWVPGQYVDSVKANEIKKIDMQIGDTMVWVNRHAKEAWSIVVSKDTCIYFNDILPYLAFFE